MKTKFLVLLLCIINTKLSATDLQHRHCATENSNSDYINQKITEGFNFDPSNYRIEGIDTVNSDTTYYINVVVHIVYFDDDKYQNISDSLIYTQIDALNRDFNLENGDTINLRDEFRQFLGNAKIKFEIAKVKPNGLPGIGITRKKVAPFPGGWSAISNNVKKENVFDINHSGVNPWPVKKYLNIWVCDLNWNTRNCDTCGFLGGYAQPPKGLPNWVIGGLDLSSQFGTETDGVVIDYRFFGQNNFHNQDNRGGSDIYGKGRTTVHEVGHYLGLRHTWGDYGTLFPEIGCTVDDGIEDTPNEALAYANYFNSNNICDTIVNSCDVPYPADGVDYPDMFENYMDYSTDRCYSLFTKDQVYLMRYALVYKRPNIISKKEFIPTSTPVKNNVINQFKVYPNPASQSLTIQLFNDTKAESLALINSLGQEVRSQLVAENTNQIILDISDLPKGIYQLQLRSKGNIGAQKVVIE